MVAVRGMVIHITILVLAENADLLNVMNFQLILNKEAKQLSQELTVVWFWYDKSDENPEYRYGTDPNFPYTAVYRNCQLVCTLNWNQNVTLQTIEHILVTSQPYQLMPGWSPVPKEYHG